MEPEVQVEPVANASNLEPKKTEEEETLMYTHSAKLFRFDSPSISWKERGVGDVKMLMNKVTKKVRIFMRSEKFFTVCANHFILPGMTLVQNAYSNRVWSWNAVGDISDDEPKTEVLALRFKTPEEGLEFKNYFDEIVKWVNDLSTNTRSVDDNTCPLPHSNAATSKPENESDQKTENNDKAEIVEIKAEQAEVNAEKVEEKAQEPKAEPIHEDPKPEVQPENEVQPEQTNEVKEEVQENKEVISDKPTENTAEPSDESLKAEQVEESKPTEDPQVTSTTDGVETMQVGENE